MSKTNRQAALDASVLYWGTAHNRRVETVTGTAEKFLEFLEPPEKAMEQVNPKGKNLDPHAFRVRNKFGSLSNKLFTSREAALRDSRAVRPIKVEFHPRPGYNKHEADYS